MTEATLFVSSRCPHSRALVGMLDKHGLESAFRFVDVDTATRIPAFVDRVPLLYTGRDVVTDEALFDYVSQRAGDTPPREGPTDPSIAPADNLCGGPFSESYSLLTNTEPKRMDNTWRLDEDHGKIPTPDSDPFPEKEG